MLVKGVGVGTNQIAPLTLVSVGELDSGLGGL